jgi:chemotaxis protein CheC
MVGVYLFIDENLPGQTLLTLTLDDAMYLADWLLEARPGSTSVLGPLEYSALAETGNVVLSSFLNALTHFTKVPLQLSPPVVCVDELPTLLEVAAASVATTDEVLIIKTDFVNVESSLLIQFWVLPDPATLSPDWVKLK